MARLRRSKLLSCFYCGKRSSIPNDGTHQNFLCLYCDATNYVDQNGEITDPPVATEREPPAPRYVKNQQPASPPSSRTDSIFCETCLKNQRLFTASLAQYLPDDPTDPINGPLDKKYYKFRRDLEERYPQVCADCEGRVQGRLQAAGYTAQTDHLRRLMANTRSRKPGKRLTKLDLAERVGRYLWWAGLFLQMLWHLKMVATILELSSESEAGMVDPDASKHSSLQRSTSVVSRWLPAGDTLIGGSITMAVISIWWNPRFVQVSRGFSRHLLGFRQWYCFQGLIVFFRIIARRIAELDGQLSDTSTSLIMPHVMMAGLMLLISVVARRSIRVNTQALFGFSQTVSSPARTTAGVGRKINSRTMETRIPVHGISEDRRAHQQRDAPDLRPLPNPQPPAMPFGSARAAPRSPVLQQAFGAPESPILAADEPEEMDWTPTQSQHRAFSNVPASGSPSRPFSQAPVQPESGPFWFKVPPAPINPAHKLRNPHKVPIVRSQPPEAKNQGFSFGSSLASQPSGPEARSTAVEFQAPTFFAPVKDDERNSLADMLNKSFSLGQEDDQDDPSSNFVSNKSDLRQRQASETTPRMELFSVALLFICLLPYVLAGQVSLPYMKELRLCATVVAGMLALSDMGQSTGAPSDAGGVTALWARFSPFVEIAEMALLCYVGWETWAGQDKVEAAGFAVLLFGFLKRGATAIRAAR